MARSEARRDRGKEQFWRRLLRLQRSSGLSIRDFCAEHDVSEASFFTWRRTIAERDRQRGRPAEPNSESTGANRDAGNNSNARTGDAPACRPEADGQPLFVPLRVISTPTVPSGPSGSESLSAFEVVLTSGRIVRVQASFEAASLRQFLAIVDEDKGANEGAVEEQPC